MSENETKSSAYEKLTPQRKQLVDQVLANLEKGNLFWTQGWVAAGAPESAVTGKKYRGINNLYLSLVAMAENYGDNRWATFRQMEEKGWTFKKDEEGHTLGKGKSVSIEYYEMRDKETKRRFDRSVLDGMTFDEQREYMDKKVEQEKSTEYIRPSELVAAEVAAKALPVSMDGRGLESLTRMSDRETLSRAETYYGKDGKFSDLYHGKNVLKSEEESEYGLMVRLAMFCGGDKDRLIRVFRSSGQYRDAKPNSYYEKMAENSLKFISDTKRSFAPMGEQSGFSKGKVGINSKR